MEDNTGPPAMGLPTTHATKIEKTYDARKGVTQNGTKVCGPGGAMTAPTNPARFATLLI